MSCSRTFPYISLKSALWSLLCLILVIRKTLNNYNIYFQIEGEGRIIGDESIDANPASVKWGTAPVLIQSTTKPGKIRIIASIWWKGSQMPTSAVLDLESKPAEHPMIYMESEAALIPNQTNKHSNNGKNAIDLEAELRTKKENDKKLKEVEQQQTDFGERN